MSIIGLLMTLLAAIPAVQAAANVPQGIENRISFGSVPKIETRIVTGVGGVGAEGILKLDPAIAKRLDDSRKGQLTKLAESTGESLADLKACRTRREWSTELHYQGKTW